MTIETWLQHATNKLQNIASHTARLDSLIITEFVTGMSRASLLAHPEKELSKNHHIQLKELLQQRYKGEPIAYIVGKKEFYGREFLVSKDVLVPRPESEAIIEFCKKYAPAVGGSLLDVGTGSGCLAITAKLELPNLQVTASDISISALKVAQKNAKILNSNVDFVQSDLFANITNSFDIIIANLPYVPDAFEVTNEVRSEPNLALFGGTDGLSIIRHFFAEIRAHLNDNGLVITESLKFQHHDLSLMAEAASLREIDSDTLIQVFEI